MVFGALQVADRVNMKLLQLMDNVHPHCKQALVTFDIKNRTVRCKKYTFYSDICVNETCPQTGGTGGLL